MKYAEHQYFLLAPQDDGKPLLDHLKAIQRTTKRVPDQIAKGPKLPEAGAPIWQIYCALSRGRSSETGITMQDIVAWCFLHERRLCQWELDVIKLLDAARYNPTDHTQE